MYVMRAMLPPSSRAALLQPSSPTQRYIMRIHMYLRIYIEGSIELYGYVCIYMYGSCMFAHAEPP